jgi:hypothetical protein
MSNFMKIILVGAELFNTDRQTHRQTDRQTLIVALRDIAKEPKVAILQASGKKTPLEGNVALLLEYVKHT